MISFPVQMTTWPKPEAFNSHYLDATTGATPLSMLKQGMPIENTTLDLLLGNVGGSLGEIGAIALLLGFAYMLWKKIITWHIPVSILTTVAIFSLLIGIDPLTQLLTGGLLLGSIFMATDYVTSPMSVNGKIIFAVGCGLLTVIIRLFGAYPEGVSFAILIMNAFVPLIDRFVRPRVFGTGRK